jgi:alginate O-acetyltransferase complex protein AlgI
LLIVVCGWVIFRCDDLFHAAGYFWAMLSLDVAGPAPWLLDLFDLKNTVLLLCAATALILPSGTLEADGQLQKKKLLPTAAGIIVFTILLPWCVVIMASGNLNPFIYYRF